MVAAERVIALVKAGKTSAEIAVELGVDVSTIRRVRKRLDIAEPQGRPSTGQREQVWFRADDDTIAALDEHAEREGSTRSEVAGRVVEAWAKRSRNARRG